jgi:hypothetical protein
VYLSIRIDRRWGLRGCSVGFLDQYLVVDDGVDGHTLAVSLSQPENSWTREKGMVNSLFSKYVPPLWMSMP